MDTTALFRELAGGFRRRSVPVLLVGGWALGFHGVPRQTVDVDLLVAESAAEAAAEVFRELGYGQVFRNPLFAKFRPLTGDGLEVDLLFADQAAADALLQAGRAVTIAGSDYTVPSLDHLLAMKLHALRHNFQTRKEKDLPDVLALLRVNGIGVASERFQTLCRKYGSPDVDEAIRRLS